MQNFATRFDADEFALSTSNLNADVDFDEQVGLFKANDEFLETTLPYNQYQTTMNEFTWDMKNQTIEFATEEGKKQGRLVAKHTLTNFLRPLEKKERKKESD